MTAANALLRALLTMERKSLTSILSSSLYFLRGCFMMLLILAVQSAKIRFYIEKAIFLFNFYDKSLVISILFLIFATDSVSPFVWVSGLFTGKGRLRNVIFEVFESRKFELASRRYCNENVHDGCIISFRIRAYCYFL